MVTSLRFKIVITLAGLALLAGVWQVWFSYSAARIIIERNAIHAVGISAAARRQALSYELRQRHERVDFLLQQLHGPCVNGNAALCGRMLQTFVTAEEEVTGAVLGSPQSGRISAGEWPETDEGQLAVTQLARFERDPQGHPYYVISASSEGVTLSLRFRMEEIESIFLDRKGLGESGESFLTDRRALFLTSARYAPGASVSHPIQARPMEMCLKGQDTEVVDQDYRGIDVVHGFRYVPEIGGGCIMAHLDSSEAFAPAEKLRDTLFVGAGAFGLVAIVLGAFAARVLTRPILALSQTASKVTGGDLDARTPVTTSDEVGTLTGTFNAMLDALQASEEGLRKARDELQLRIDERTADLRQANETLQAQIAKREQAEEALRSHAKRLEALKAIDRDILGAPSPEVLAEVTLHHVCRLVPCLRSSIAVFDLEAGQGTVYAAKDEHAEQRELAVGSRVPLSAYGDPAELAQGVVTRVPDILALPKTPIFEALAARGVRSWINVPLISQGELFGTLNISWEFPRGFSEESVDLAREVANGVALGIRQARLLEQVQRYAADLEARVAERTAELDAFSYSVSHDLRVPLRAVDAFSRILHDEYADRLDPEGRRLVGVIHASARTMGELIEGLLALSRLGSQEMSFSEVDLGELAVRVFDELRARRSPSRPSVQRRLRSAGVG
jgi:HAMP domain-containing protein